MLSLAVGGIAIQTVGYHLQIENMPPNYFNTKFTGSDHYLSVTTSLYEDASWESCDRLSALRVGETVARF